MKGSPQLVCVGDSLTKGQVSSNYVKLLAKRWEPSGWRIVNAGVNGQLVYNVAQRLQSVIDLQPDVVTLLAGTNDVNAQFDEAWGRRYRTKQRLPVDPSHELFAQQLDGVLDRLRSQTDARVAVLTLPPLGEDLTSRINTIVTRYNTTVVDIAAKHGVAVLPVHQRLVDLIPADRNPPAYDGDIAAIASAAIQHYVRRRSWNEISRRNGLTLLTDHVHLNDAAAATVAQLISDFVDTTLSAPHQPTGDD